MNPTPASSDVSVSGIDVARKIYTCDVDYVVSGGLSVEEFS